MRNISFLIILLLVYLDVVAQEEHHKHEPHRHLKYANMINPVAMTAQSIAEGAKLYDKHCIACHGESGKGGIGPTLTGPVRIHGGTDGEMFHIITVGVAGKKILVVTGMIIGLTVATALAQMGGGGTGGQPTQQSGGMMSSQMMSQEMMRDMSGMMRQMNEMMQKLTHTMEHKTVTDHAMMQDMGKMMHEMAGQMEEMATHMEQGKMDQATVKKMHEKMQSMNKKLDAMQKGAK